VSSVEQDLKAAKHLRALRKIEKEMANNEAVYDGLVAEALEWLDNANHSLRKERDHHTEELKLIAVNYNFGKKKSRKLPPGVFGWKKKPERLRVVDSKAALEWAKREGVATEKVVYGFKQKDLENCVKLRGELPDGCDVVEASDEFYVRLEG